MKPPKRGSLTFRSDVQDSSEYTESNVNFHIFSCAMCGGDECGDM